MLQESELIINLSPNYTEGRQGTPVRHLTFHHIVGPVSSAISRFSNPANQVSTHFAVGAKGVYCFVDTDNTAWGNGNWLSNLESVSIEHEGDWRNGFRDEAVIANSVRLVAWLRSLYPTATPTRHRDIIATACPGDLPVEEIWNKATLVLHPVPPPPPPPPPAPSPPPIVVPAPVDSPLDKENNALLKQILASLQSLIAKFTSIFK